MSLHPNTVQYGPQNIQMKAPQNNLLLYNAYNNINQGKNDTLNLNMLNSKTSSVNPIYLTTNNNNSTITNNRKGSLDKKFYPSKKYQTIDINDPSRAKRNLSSSGVLKLSRRNHRFDRVLKNGKKLKNIDINRDYDEEPEDDTSTKMSSSSKIIKNKLKTSLNKNESDKSNIKSNQGINSINNNANNTNNNNKGSFINANNKVLNLKSNNSLSNNNINNSNNNNNNNNDNNNNLYNKDRSHFSTKSFQYLNINSSKNITNINKDKERNISRGNTKKLTYYNTRPNIGFMKKQSMNLDDVVKKLSKKEQSYFILSRSPVLRLTERLFFGRSTANLRNVQTVTDILKKNERLLKNKKKELEGKLSECDKRINKVFNASKTAEINFNFILTKDEDELKSYIWFAENEKEKSEYYCYIKLLYLLFNEKYEKIELKHLTDKLYALINKKGHKTIKEYLYLIYFKKKENINIVYNIDNINHLLEESSVDINYNIKFCRFALFTSFLIKEIITYGNEIKNTVELKLKTKEFIDVINKKLELYKNGNYLKKIK